MSPNRAPVLSSLLLASVALTAGACGSTPLHDASSGGTAGGLAGSGGAPGESGGSAGNGGAASSAAATGSGGATGPGGGGAPAASCAAVLAGEGAVSAWVSVDASGKLAYAKLPTGERILDFSYAGYRGGGVAIPVVPVQKTVQPSGGADDTAAIQAAIDAVSAMSPVNGLRGAVLLAPGTFALQGSLSVTTSGVVLRGSGSGAGGTVLHVTGSPRGILSIAGTGTWKATGTPAKITVAYVPSGARSFHVDSAAGLTVGAKVLVDRPVTAAWIHFMGMDKLVRNGQPQTWIAAGTVIHSDRVVTAIAGDEVTVDAPISDSLDAQYTSATVVPYTFAGRLEQVGLEALRVVAPMQTVPINQPVFDLLNLDAVESGWVKDVAAEEVTGGFTLGSTAKWITIEDSSVSRTAPIDGSQGYPFHYSIGGQQTLVLRSSSTADNVYSYVTQARTPGPNVALDYTSAGNPTNVEPHQRWATGLLLDGVESPEGGINLKDRGYYGSGHGWTIGFGVVWNGVGKSLLIQQPPGAQNWAIGSKGTVTQAGEPGKADQTPMPSGIIDAHGTPVAPRSLYLAQLCERLGPQAVANIGY